MKTGLDRPLGGALCCALCWTLGGCAWRAPQAAPAADAAPAFGASVRAALARQQLRAEAAPAAPDGMEAAAARQLQLRHQQGGAGGAGEHRLPPGGAAK